MRAHVWGELWKCVTSVTHLTNRELKGLKFIKLSPVTVFDQAPIKPSQLRKGAMETDMAMVSTTIRIPEPGGDKRAPTIDRPREIARRVKSGKLSERHGVAYARLAADLELASASDIGGCALGRLVDYGLAMDVGRGASDMPAMTRADVVGPALKAVGPIGASLLIAMIIRGETAAEWAQNAEASGWSINPSAAAGVLLGALDRLADHFALDAKYYLPVSN